MSNKNYEAGVCNIGEAEKKKRYQFGFAGFIAAILLVAIVLWRELPQWLLLSSFVPLILGFEGFLQGKLSFCAAFASRGIYDVSVSGDKTKRVEKQEAHKKDMKKAKRIHIYSITSSVIVAIIIYLIL